mmetsp:Transcript_5483/g.13358  ORF Transcript_5483/g.13358 Transcript_5483/m.13358 type:complete len:103 (-) Transcript_5483:22-330(-)
MSALIEACKEGKFEDVKELVNSGDEDLNKKDELEQTALIWAVRSGNAEIVELLCDSGADVKISSQTGTALEIAEEEGHEDIMKILKDAGADGGGGGGDDDGG